MGQVVTKEVLYDALAVLVSIMNERTRTRDHCVRVSEYSVRTAQAAGWDKDAIEMVRLGALFHDIGHVMFSQDFIEKEASTLTEEDKEKIREHTRKGAELIHPWPTLRFLEPYILYHQEWVDGSGYPFGLTGDSIPKAVQLVSIADVYEALRHPREYLNRAAFSHDEAINLMNQMSGKRWDTALFQLFAQASRLW